MSEIETLEILVLKRLRDLASTKGKEQCVESRELFSSIPPIFGVSEMDEWNVLKGLEERGYIEVVPSKGIRLKA